MLHAATIYFFLIYSPILCYKEQKLMKLFVMRFTLMIYSLLDPNILFIFSVSNYLSSAFSLQRVMAFHLHIDLESSVQYSSSVLAGGVETEDH